MRSESSRVPLVVHLAAGTAVALAICAGVITAGLFPQNGDWGPAWIGLTLLYGAGAVALWQRRPWAREFMLGVAGWGLCAWIDAVAVLGFSSLTVSATVGHALMVGLAALVPASLSRRHSWSLLLASAALPCGIAFGLAPEQSLGMASAMLGGTGLLLVGAIGLARGRTWGLLTQLAGAPLVAFAAFYAPRIAWLEASHPMLPDNGILLSFVGMCAAALALASFVPFAGPVVRHLRR
jgi:hypothetical protein